MNTKLNIHDVDHCTQPGKYNSSNKNKGTFLSLETVMDVLSDWSTEPHFLNYSTIIFKVHGNTGIDPIVTFYGGMNRNKGPYFFEANILGDDLVGCDGYGTELFDAFYYVKDKKKYYLRDSYELRSFMKSL